MSQLNTSSVPLRSVLLLVFAYTDFQISQEKNPLHGFFIKALCHVREQNESNTESSER